MSKAPFAYHRFRPGNCALPWLKSSARHGNRSEALHWIEEIRKAQQEQFRATFHIAMVYGALGDRGHAIESLEEAYRTHYPFIWQARSEPLFDPIRNDPRFVAIFARMGLR